MSASSGEGSEPNLTPILDMVFQLITFFMLVINFKGATFDQTLKLPVLGSARPIEFQPEKEPLVLNVDPEGQIRVYMKPVPNIDEYISREANLVKQMLRARGEKVDGNIATPVMLRADKNVPFSRLNKIIKICQSHGYHNFQLSAMSKEG